MSVIEIRLEEAKAALEAYRLAWEKARQRKTAMLAEHAVSKAPMPNNYWVEEQRARAMYEAAQVLIEVLTPLELT